jgi:hypothetical protein
VVVGADVVVRLKVRRRRRIGEPVERRQRAPSVLSGEAATHDGIREVLSGTYFTTRMLMFPARRYLLAFLDDLTNVSNLTVWERRSWKDIGQGRYDQPDMGCTTFSDNGDRRRAG